MWLGYQPPLKNTLPLSCQAFPALNQQTAQARPPPPPPRFRPFPPLYWFFAYKPFLSLNISDFNLYFMWKLQLFRHFPLSQQSPSKSQGPLKLPFWKSSWRLNPPPPLQKGGAAHYAGLPPHPRQLGKPCQHVRSLINFKKARKSHPHHHITCFLPLCSRVVILHIGHITDPLVIWPMQSRVEKGPSWLFFPNHFVPLFRQ